MPDLTPNAGQSLNITFSGQLPGEALVKTIVDARMKWLELILANPLTPDALKLQVIKNEVEADKFWHDVTAPFRWLGSKIEEAQPK